MSTLQGMLTYSAGESFPQTIRSYQGFRSGTVLSYIPPNGHFMFYGTYGVVTPANNFPIAGKATYQGVAFDHSEKGTLTYHVDFVAKNGYNEINGLPRLGIVTLNNARIQVESTLNGNDYIGRGTASSAKGSTFNYTVAFSGYQAEEVAGYMHNAQNEAIGFHSTSGAITE